MCPFYNGFSASDGKKCPFYGGFWHHTVGKLPRSAHFTGLFDVSKKFGRVAKLGSSRTVRRAAQKI